MKGPVLAITRGIAPETAKGTGAMTGEGMITAVGTDTAVKATEAIIDRQYPTDADKTFPMINLREKFPKVATK